MSELASLRIFFTTVGAICFAVAMFLLALERLRRRLKYANELRRLQSLETVARKFVKERKQMHGVRVDPHGKYQVVGRAEIEAFWVLADAVESLGEEGKTDV